MLFAAEETQRVFFVCKAVCGCTVSDFHSVAGFKPSILASQHQAVLACFLLVAEPIHTKLLTPKCDQHQILLLISVLCKTEWS